MRAMLSIRVIAAMLVFSFLAFNCEDAGSGPGGSATPAGAYRYQSFDSTGIPLVKGWFTLVFSDPDHCTGEWHFAAIGSRQKIGPQVGDGNLVGGTTDGSVWVELQPQFRDNNLELVGTIQDGRYRGRWIWISFVGETNSGFFDAKRQ